MFWEREGGGGMCTAMYFFKSQGVGKNLDPKGAPLNETLYSGTSLIWTPLGKHLISRGVPISEVAIGTAKCPVY